HTRSKRDWSSDVCSSDLATIVSTKVLTPFQAVLWAAIFNFAAFFIFKYFIGEFRIGNTIANFVHRDFITLPVIFSGLIAAITWRSEERRVGKEGRMWLMA